LGVVHKLFKLFNPGEVDPAKRKRKLKSLLLAAILLLGYRWRMR